VQVAEAQGDKIRLTKADKIPLREDRTVAPAARLVAPESERMKLPGKISLVLAIRPISSAMPLKTADFKEAMQLTSNRTVLTASRAEPAVAASAAE